MRRLHSAPALAALAVLAACDPPSPRAAANAALATIPARAAAPAAADTVPVAMIGDYAAGADTVIVRERDGRLELLFAGAAYAMDATGDAAFRLRGDGRHDGATATVLRDPAGAVGAIAVAGRAYDRLRYGAEDGATFRIRPVRPVAELRRAALAASPPVEEGGFRAPDLVDLETLDPALRFDIRYAGADNFMGEPFYQEPRALLQRPAAEALVRAHRRLAERGLGLLVFDAYRPWHVTWMFFHATPSELRMFVANPAHGSRHNRGAAVDVTLYDRATGRPLPMPSGYDEFSPRAFPDYPGGTTEQRRNRDLLRRAMEAEGFEVYYAEWWHFDHRDWRNWPILDLTFDRIQR